MIVKEAGVIVYEQFKIAVELQLPNLKRTDTGILYSPTLTLREEGTNSIFVPTTLLVYEKFGTVPEYSEDRGFTVAKQSRL